MLVRLEPAAPRSRVKHYTTEPLHSAGICSEMPDAYFLDIVKYHWRSSHYTVTHVRNKNSNNQRRSPNVVKVIFHAIRNCS